MLFETCIMMQIVQQGGICRGMILTTATNIDNSIYDLQRDMETCPFCRDGWFQRLWIRKRGRWTLSKEKKR